MALLFFDGCGEYYATADVQQVWTHADSVTVQPTSGRRGDACISIGGSTQEVHQGFPSTGTIVFGTAWKVPTIIAGNTTYWEIWGTGPFVHVSLQVTATGAIRCLNGGSTEIVVSAAGVVTADTWHYLEFKVTISDTIGQITVRVDEVEVIGTDADENTRNAGDSDLASMIKWRGPAVADGHRFDDVYILNTDGDSPYNDFLGDAQIDAVLPDGTGASSDFDTTQGSATHYENVDEATPNGDTDYNETNTANDVDLFEYAALPAIADGATVFGVKVTSYLNKQDAGSAPVRMVARPAATNRNGVSLFPQTSYRYPYEIWPDNPETSTPWTDATINASEYGVEYL
jgi:hypothetical protein